MVLVVQHEVELIKVSVNQAMIGQFDDKLHELAVQCCRVLELMHLTSAALGK